MIDERFVYLAICFNIFGSLDYLISTLKGENKPHKVTWFLWFLAPFVALLGQIQKGVGIQSLLTLIITLNTLVIFLASFINKKADWKVTKFDVGCGALSLGGLFLWYTTGEGNVAIFFAILADFLACIPTLIKIYTHPQTESYKVYVFAAISSFITILTLKDWDFAHLSFPLYIFLICIVFVIMGRFRTGKMY